MFETTTRQTSLEKVLGRVSRRSFLNLGLAVVVSLCLESDQPTVQHDPYDFTTYSLTGLVNIMKVTKESDHLRQATTLVIERMEQQGLREVLVGFNGNLYSAGDQEFDLKTMSKYTSAPIICRSDSPILSPLYDELGDHKNMARENLSWIILTPNVLRRVGDHDKAEMGLSIGDGVVYVNTHNVHSANGALELPPVLAHEAQHEANGRISRLHNERSAHTTQRDVARLKSDENKGLEAMVHTCSARIETADYLGSFGSEFEQVYPKEMILAGELLDAYMSPSALAEYSSENFAKVGNLAKFS